MTKLSTLADALATATVAYYIAVEFERECIDGPNAKARAERSRAMFNDMVNAQNAMAAEAQRIAQETI